MAQAPINDIHWGDEDERAEPDKRVSTLELFFDLVFVFTLTQLTELLAHELSVAGFVRVLLIFGVSWWMYGGYAWLTNHLDLDRPARRITLLAAMSAFLLQALAIPHAFNGSGLAFGLGYLAVVLVHASLFWQATRAIGRTAMLNVGSALLVIIAGFVHGWPDYVLWTLALAVQVATPFLIRLEDFHIRPAHFVERHGLLMIVALGESVVAIGIGAGELAIDAGLATAVVLGVALVACLWWTYLAEDDQRAEHALAHTPAQGRAALAIHAYLYAHIPMLLGVLCIAVGIKNILAHPGDALATAPAVALGGGVALYMAGDVAFRRVLGIGRGTTRAVVGLAALATIPLGAMSAMLQLVTLVLLFLAAFGVEAAPASAARPGAAKPAGR
jgi:low temperature requirement protein LtrA